MWTRHQQLAPGLSPWGQKGTLGDRRLTHQVFQADIYSLPPKSLPPRLAAEPATLLMPRSNFSSAQTLLPAFSGLHGGHHPLRTLTLFSAEIQKPLKLRERNSHPLPTAPGRIFLRWLCIANSYTVFLFLPRNSGLEENTRRSASPRPDFIKFPWRGGAGGGTHAAAEIRLQPLLIAFSHPGRLQHTEFVKLLGNPSR